MARTAKRYLNGQKLENSQVLVYKTAIYARLSVDHEDKKSESIETQVEMLKEFIRHQNGNSDRNSELVLYDVYTDLGKTGTNFERPGFERLMADIRAGLINCIIVKDFSRFGRDYLEVGFYIEYIFPLLQIRFISINDSYDSAASSGMTGGMNVALQNLVYNMYSLDLSKKISSALQTRTRNGTRLPVNARYGYKKRNRASAEMLRCPNQWRSCVPKSGDS